MDYHEPPTLAFWRRKRIEFVPQDERSDCGLACLSMVLRHYGLRMDLRSLSLQTGGFAHGMTAADLRETAHEYGLVGRTLKVGMNRLKDMQPPCILHWNLNHFVVLERFSKNSAVILDPAMGRMTISHAEFSDHYTGICIDLRPDESFRPANLRRGLRFRDVARSIPNLRPALFLITLVFLVTNIFSFFVPQVFQFAIDMAVQQNSRELVPVLFGGLFIFGMVLLLVTTMMRIFLANFHEQLSFGVFQRIIRRVLFLPNSYFVKRSVGDTMSRIQSFDTIENAITSDSIAALMTSLFGLLSIFVVFFYSKVIFLMCIAFAVLNIFILLLFYKPIQNRMRREIVAAAQAETKMIENITAMASIKSLGIETDAFNRMVSSEAEATNARLDMERLSIIQSVPTEILGNLQQLAIPGVAIYLVAAGDLTIGMFYAITVYTSRFTEGVSEIIGLVTAFIASRVQLGRLSDIMLAPTERPVPPFMNNITEAEEEAEFDAEEPENYQPIKVNVQTISIRNVSFGYGAGKHLIVNNVSLSVGLGARICIVGASGSGKSTLLRIMTALETPVSGALYVNDMEFRPMMTQSFRGQVAVQTQEDTLFSGSIIENLTMGSERRDLNRVHYALELAQVRDEIEALPMGVQTLIGDMGSVLSAGQQQRLILARALYRKPKFLFLDEGTANIDHDTKLKVMQNLCALDIGLLYVTHDSETVRFADQVFEMADGHLSPADMSRYAR